MKWCHGSDECENVHLALKQKCKYVFKGFLIKKVSEVSSAEAIDLRPSWLKIRKQCGFDRKYWSHENLQSSIPIICSYDKKQNTTLPCTDNIEIKAKIPAENIQNMFNIALPTKNAMIVLIEKVKQQRN